MKGFAIGMATVGFVMLAIVATFLLTWMSANNSEASARNAFLAQQKSNESSFDKMWKIIQQSAEIPTAERESFRQTYTEIMTATKGVAGNGQLASFFSQAKVDISPDLFRKLMTTIEAQRESFHREQQHLAKLKQQHDDVRQRWPSAFFVGGRPELELKMVTSAKTDAAFESGKDDGVSLGLSGKKE